MIQILRKIRKLAIKSKIYIERIASWLSIINAGMILFLVLSKLQDYGYNVYITKYFFPIFALTIILMIFLGYLDELLGGHREEARERAEMNPYYKEIVERLERIEGKIK